MRTHVRTHAHYNFYYYSSADICTHKAAGLPRVQVAQTELADHFSFHLSLTVTHKKWYYKDILLHGTLNFNPSLKINI